MPADETLLGQGLVDERNEGRRPLTRAELQAIQRSHYVDPGTIVLREISTADEHECGQLRIAVPGEQVSLLPLPDKEIPTDDEPQTVDELEAYAARTWGEAHRRAVAELERARGKQT